MVRWSPPSTPWQQVWQRTGPSTRPLTWSACGPTWMTILLSTGAAAALLDRDGRVTASPYVYRSGDGYATLDLAVPSYKHRLPGLGHGSIGRKRGSLDAPYFDAGGGEIWMVTRSVPVRDAEGIFALVTTDLPVEAP